MTALRNLPLDLYLLMDLSGSMTQDLDGVKTISSEIGEFPHTCLHKPVVIDTSHTHTCKGGGTTGATGALAPLKFSPPKIFSGQ